MLQVRWVQPSVSCSVQLKYPSFRNVSGIQEDSSILIFDDVVATTSKLLCTIIASSDTKELKYGF